MAFGGLLGMLDEDQRTALLMAASRAMQSRGNAGQAAGAALEGGIMGYQGSQALKDRRAEEEQQRQMRAMQMEQMKRGLLQQGKMDSLANSAFGPNPNLVANDDEGNAMPQAPGGGGMPEYARGMAQIDPMKAMQLQQMIAQMGAKERGTLKPGETAGTWEGGKFVPGYTAPDKAKHLPGETRVLEMGRVKYTQEMQPSGEWKVIGKSAVDAPDKPAQPQLYEGPSGPMWIQPPARGQGAQPVTGPGGQPIPAKMPAEQKSEITKLDAEMGIIDGALKAVTKTPSAFSIARGAATLAGTIPESLAGRLDKPEERQARSYLFNVVSKVINERAGAAQSAQELARLRSFLPGETDEATQIQDKLKAYKSYLSEKRAGFAGSNPQPGGWSIRQIP